jgi:hypothetical protein
MSIKLGSTPITKIMLGSTPISKVMLGSSLVWEAAGGIAYLLEENFEGTGYENTWTETGTPDEDYSTTGLSMQGSQCVRFNATETYITHTLPSAYSPIEVYFQLRFAAWPSPARNILTLQNASGTNQLVIYKGTADSITLRTPTLAPQTTLYGLALNTTYHVWIRYEKGTGGNAKMWLALSTDGIRPTSGSLYAYRDTGTATKDISKIAIGMLLSATVDMFVDRILVSQDPIGDNP